MSGARALTLLCHWGNPKTKEDDIRRRRMHPHVKVRLKVCCSLGRCPSPALHCVPGLKNLTRDLTCGKDRPSRFSDLIQFPNVQPSPCCSEKRMLKGVSVVTPDCS